MPREKMCIDEISTKMPLILAQLFYKHNKIEKTNVNKLYKNLLLKLFHDTIIYSKIKYIDIYEKLKIATIKKIENLKWMDAESKNLTNYIVIT